MWRDYNRKWKNRRWILKKVLHLGQNSKGKCEAMNAREFMKKRSREQCVLYVNPVSSVTACSLSIILTTNTNCVRHESDWVKGFHFLLNNMAPKLTAKGFRNRLLLELQWATGHMLDIQRFRCFIILEISTIKYPQSHFPVSPAGMGGSMNMEMFKQLHA